MALAYPDPDESLDFPDTTNTSSDHFSEQKNPHCSETMSLMNSLRLDDSFCDVTVVVQYQTFRAHKLVLAAASGFFRSMFMMGYSESYLGEVRHSNLFIYLFIHSFIYL